MGLEGEVGLKPNNVVRDGIPELNNAHKEGT